MELDFEHKSAAHCETGVIVNLLRFYGFDISEPMIFGLSSGLFFSHMPFVKLAGMAVTSFRTFPGVLFSRVARLLGANDFRFVKRTVLFAHAICKIGGHGCYFFPHVSGRVIFKSGAFAGIQKKRQTFFQ